MAYYCVTHIMHIYILSICVYIYIYCINSHVLHLKSPFVDELACFFPTCQVRVVRFYVSCLLLPPPDSCLVLLLLLSSSSSSSSNCDPRSTVFSVGPQPRPSTPSVPCRTSTTTIHAQCSLPDLNHDHPRPVFPAGPQPRLSNAQCSLPGLNHDHPRPVLPAGPQPSNPPSVPCRTSTASIHAKCSLPDLM